MPTASFDAYLAVDWSARSSPSPRQPGATVPRVIHVEIWPGMLAARLDPAIPIRDQAQVHATAA